MPKAQTKELTVAAVEKEISPVVKSAMSLDITNAGEMEIATEVLSQLNKAKDLVTEKMDTIIKPQKEAIKAAEAIWKPWINQVKEAVTLIRDKMSDYQTKKEDEARIEADKIAARVGEGKGKLKMTTAMKQIGEIDAPVGKVETDSGSLRFTPTKMFKIVDISKIPAKYMVPDEVAIRAAMKAGIELPGVEYFIKQVPVNNR